MKKLYILTLSHYDSDGNNYYDEIYPISMEQSVEEFLTDIKSKSSDQYQKLKNLNQKIQTFDWKALTEENHEVLKEKNELETFWIVRDQIGLDLSGNLYRRGTYREGLVKIEAMEDFQKRAVQI